MRERLIVFLKTHPIATRCLWGVARFVLRLVVNISTKQNTILFCSFGGRGFNDSPKAVYDEVCKREAFNDWEIVWAFVDPDKISIPRGKKVRIDTFRFFKILATSRIWVSNSGMDRGVDLVTDKIIRVETWHGTPLKRICGEEQQTGIVYQGAEPDRIIDDCAIRCAQSEFDREIFARVFHATKDSILLSDLPRNDELLNYTAEQISEIREELEIDSSKKIILYTPTYREYLINEENKNYIAPPIDWEKWSQELGKQYVLLVRAHYAVSAALGIAGGSFVKDVSSYYSLNNLYAIADMMISDYSSTYFDYSILDRPMLCFAYDKDEYEEKRGLYLDLEKDLPCRVCRTEDDVISEIKNMNFASAIELTKVFHEKYAPYAGNASKEVVDVMLSKLG